MDYKFEALTDVWTGSVTFEEKNGQIRERMGPDRLINTGLLGSIRWWFEMLVRGLGGCACDPSDTTCEGRSHCVVCELFGCTGWARKFRFEILDEKGQIKRNQIKQTKTFSLRFTPLRSIHPEEWVLLATTLRLIAEYGVIGGKTVLKPSDQNSRNQHKDYGLIKFVEPSKINIAQDVLQKYISQHKWRRLDHGGFGWASLQNFWCVNGKCLKRKDNNNSTFNQVIGRKESKNQAQQLVNSDIAKWLAGSPQESKKVFSFKNPARTFGFVNPAKKFDFDAMKAFLTNAWGQNDWDFFCGDKIIDQLFAGKEARS